MLHTPVLPGSGITTKSSTAIDLKGAEEKVVALLGQQEGLRLIRPNQTLGNSEYSFTSEHPGFKTLTERLSRRRWTLSDISYNPDNQSWIISVGLSSSNGDLLEITIDQKGNLTEKDIEISTGPGKNHYGKPPRGY